MMKALLSATVAIAATTVAITANAATLIGATVNVSARYPNTTTVYADGGNKVVTDGVEYGTGSFAAYNPGFSIDVQADGLVIFFTGNPNFATAAFNGFVLRVLSGPALTNATIDAASTFSSISATVTNGDLFLNYSGVQGTSNDTNTSIIRFTGFSAAVPEPATWGLMVFGFGMIGAAARSRKIKTTVSFA